LQLKTSRIRKNTLTANTEDSKQLRLWIQRIEYDKNVCKLINLQIIYVKE